MIALQGIASANSTKRQRRRSLAGQIQYLHRQPAPWYRIHGGFGSRSTRECQRRLGFHRDGHGRPGTGLTAGKRGRSSPTVMSVSRRAWCRESGPPRSRGASGSNLWPPTRTNLRILSHGTKPSANAGEREMLRRGIRRSRLVQSGCGEEVLSQSPGGIHGPQFRSGGTVRVKSS